MARSLPEVISTEVLVIGGGLAGCWAALTAVQQNKEVLLVDKGMVGKTSCSTFASGDIACCLPTDEVDLWEEEFLACMEGLADKYWVRACLEDIYPRILDMEKLGVRFVKENGSFLRTRGRGRHVRGLLFSSRQMMEIMRRRALGHGVKILDRTFTYSLMLDKGRCTGAVALDTREGKPLVIKAKVTILAAGGCGFRGTFYGHQFATGDAHALALSAGAEQVGFEFVTYNLTHPRFDLSGISILVALGGKFVNGSGEPFMEHYDPDLKDRAPLHRLIWAMTEEVRAGRGPIFIDMREVEEGSFRASLNALPHVYRILARAHLDLRKEPLELVPSSGFTYAMTTGCFIGRGGETNVPGLHAAGTAGAIYRGAGAGLNGLNLMACVISGYRVGKAAAAESTGISFPEAGDEWKLALDEMYRPMTFNGRFGGMEVLREVQQTLFPAPVMLVKEDQSLRNALANLEDIEKEKLGQVSASDAHTLVKVHELQNMVTTARLFLLSSLRREESRGSHIRRDYPVRDDRNWLKWLTVRCEGGSLKFNEHLVTEGEGDD